MNYSVSWKQPELSNSCPTQLQGAGAASPIFVFSMFLLYCIIIVLWSGEITIPVFFVFFATRHPFIPPHPYSTCGIIDVLLLRSISDSQTRSITSYMTGLVSKLYRASFIISEELPTYCQSLWSYYCVYVKRATFPSFFFFTVQLWRSHSLSTVI